MRAEQSLSVGFYVAVVGVGAFVLLPLLIEALTYRHRQAVRNGEETTLGLRLLVGVLLMVSGIACALVVLRLRSDWGVYLACVALTLVTGAISHLAGQVVGQMNRREK